MPTIELSNKSMERMLQNGEAIDVSRMPRQGSHYVLNRVIDGMDYCNAETEEWIYSIGRRKSDGVILASTTSEFYQNPRFECLWLR